MCHSQLSWCAQSCLLQVKPEHGKMPEKYNSGDTSMVAKASPFLSQLRVHHFPKYLLQCCLVLTNKGSLLKTDLQTVLVLSCIQQH